MYFTAWGINPVFPNNYKWSVTFKNCESLLYTRNIYIVNQVHLNLKKNDNFLKDELTIVFPVKKNILL